MGKSIDLQPRPSRRRAMERISTFKPAAYSVDDLPGVLPDAVAPTRQQSPVIPRAFKVGKGVEPDVRVDLQRFVDQMMGDGEVEKAIQAAGVVNGVNMANLAKIVFTGPADAKAAGHPIVKPGGRLIGVNKPSLIIPFSGGSARMDVCHALLDIIPHQERPVEITLNENGASLQAKGLLSDEVLERAEAVSSWRDFNPDSFSGGRSVHINVPEATIGGIVYDRLKLKAVVRNSVLQPSDMIHTLSSVSTDDNQVSFTGDFDFDDEGRIVIKPYLNLRGGMTLEKAEQGAIGGVLFHKAGLAGELVVGHGEYTSVQAHGRKTGFVLTLVPKNSVEVWDNLIQSIFDLYLGYASTGSIDPLKANRRLHNVIAPLGRRLRDANDKQLCHGYPSPANALMMDGEVLFKDFHQVRRILRTDRKRQVAFRLHDIAACVRHTTMHLGTSPPGILKFLETIGFEPSYPVIMGYFYNYYGDPRLTKIKATDIEACHRQATQEPAHQIDSPLIGLLDDTVQRKPYKRNRKGANMPTRPMLPAGSRVSTSDVIAITKTHDDLLMDLFHRGYRGVDVTVDDGSGKIEVDKESQALLVYLPKDMGRLEATTWFAENIKPKKLPKL